MPSGQKSSNSAGTQSPSSSNSNPSNTAPKKPSYKEYILGKGQTQHSCTLNTLGVGGYIADYYNSKEDIDVQEMAKQILTINTLCDNTYKNRLNKQDHLLTFDEGKTLFNNAAKAMGIESQEIEGKTEYINNSTSRNYNNYLQQSLKHNLGQLNNNETFQLIHDKHAIAVGLNEGKYWIFDARANLSEKPNDFESVLFEFKTREDLENFLYDKYKKGDHEELKTKDINGSPQPTPPIEIHFFKTLNKKLKKKEKEEPPKKQEEFKIDPNTQASLTKFMSDKIKKKYPALAAWLTSKDVAKPDPTDQVKTQFKNALAHKKTKDVKAAMKLIEKDPAKLTEKATTESWDNETQKTANEMFKQKQAGNDLVLMTFIPNHQNKKDTSEGAKDLIKVEAPKSVFADYNDLIKKLKAADIKIQLDAGGAVYRVIGRYNDKKNRMDFYLEDVNNTTAASRQVTAEVLKQFKERHSGKTSFCEYVQDELKARLPKVLAKDGKNVAVFTQTREIHKDEPKPETQSKPKPGNN